uniref:Laminin G domain-containing protein n=1 Tax=Anolis carolinensis TaxID=28377 RepID=A0A803TMG9_ANOCA
MATFVTKNTSGIILVGLSKGAEKRRRRQAHLPFFSIVLVNGHLAVHVNAGDRASTRKVLVQPDNGTYSDGQEHSVILTRNKRMIMVQVDENSPAEIRLGPLAEARPMNISHLFIGGIPAGEGILGLKMTNSFYGCITNLIFNMEDAPPSGSYWCTKVPRFLNIKKTKHFSWQLSLPRFKTLQNAMIFLPLYLKNLSISLIYWPKLK